MVWRTWLTVAVVVGGGWCQDRWVWGKSTNDHHHHHHINSNSNSNSNSKASSIPGYVEPTTISSTGPPLPLLAPPVTTFRPPFRPVGRASPRTEDFPRASANPLFLGSFPPYSLVPVSQSHPAGDGTTKSRVTADAAAFDGASGAVLDAGDKYTTLDRLQSERGAPPTLPRPKEHQLGGLHPDEVFYADDDLLIIKGGGFNSDAFQEPSQPLDADDEEDTREGSASRVSSIVVPLPSPDQEYNGNIPAIVPPPSPRRPITHHPLTLFVGEGTADHYLLVPYVYPRPGAPLALQVATNDLIAASSSGENNNVRRSTAQYPYVFPPPYITHRTPVAHRHHQPSRHQQPTRQAFHHQPPHHSNTILHLPHSLAGDTDVNYRLPRPPVNPEAEVFDRPTRRQNHYYPGRFRQQGRPRL